MITLVAVWEIQWREGIKMWCQAVTYTDGGDLDQRDVSGNRVKLAYVGSRALRICLWDY